MTRTHLIVAAVTALLVGGNADAQTARSGGDDATARLQQMLQQANADKTSLAAEVKQLKDKLQAAEKDLASVRKERDGLTGRITQAEGKVQRAEAGRQTVDASLDATQTRLQEIVGKYRELAESTRQVEGERNKVAGDLARASRELDSCKAANVALADIGEEALRRYEDKGVFTSLAQKEPFTGLQRTRIANLVDGYRSEIEAKRLEPKAQSQSTPPAP